MTGSVESIACCSLTISLKVAHLDKTGGVFNFSSLGMLELHSLYGLINCVQTRVKHLYTFPFFKDNYLFVIYTYAAVTDFFPAAM